MTLHLESSFPNHKKPSRLCGTALGPEASRCTPEMEWELRLV